MKVTDLGKELLVSMLSRCILSVRKCCQYRQIITILPMPKLSPTMTSGVVREWCVKQGQKVDAYTVMCIITAKNLTNDTKDNEDKWLELEIQEDCVVSQMLKKEGDIVIAGHPLAVLCDSDEDTEIRDSSHINVEGDIYEQGNIRMAGWQAYILKCGEI